MRWLKSTTFCHYIYSMHLTTIFFISRHFLNTIFHNIKDMISIVISYNKKIPQLLSGKKYIYKISFMNFLILIQLRPWLGTGSPAVLDRNPVRPRWWLVERPYQQKKTGINRAKFFVFERICPFPRYERRKAVFWIHL